MKNKSVLTWTGGGGSPEQSQEVVWSHEMAKNYEQSSARRGKPRFDAQARALAFSAKGGEPAERCAFTMAEILLSLTIIGVVAAITLPSLTGNINERTWNTQRKALYARMSQAIALMPSLNGYGQLTEEQKDADGNITQSAVDTAAETFVTAGLSKVLKINNICDADHLKDCGFPEKITKMDGSIAFSQIPKTLVEYNNMFSGTFDEVVHGWHYEYHQTDTKAVAFETANGESLLVYYNPQCKPDMGETKSYYAQAKMCANFVYDLNGNKGPNTFGKDIGFITALYPSDSVVVAPMPVTQNFLASSQYQAGQECKKVGENVRLPNIHEGMALIYNSNLTGMTKTTFWSSSKFADDTSKGWIYGLPTTLIGPYDVNEGWNVWCVKR